MQVQRIWWLPVLVLALGFVLAGLFFTMRRGRLTEETELGDVTPEGETGSDVAVPIPPPMATDG